MGTAIWLLAALAGCSGSGRPGADASAERDATFADPRAQICAQVDASRTVSFDVIQRIFDDQCVSCHTVGSDLQLQSGVSWTNLVNRPAPPAESCGGTLVVPGDPARSYLYLKLTSSSPCAGLQMPRGELGSSPLPACVIAIISAWIREGAPGPTPDGG